jgi:hypothetical protein
MLNPDERDRIVTAVTMLVATHQSGRVSQPRRPDRLAARADLELAQEAATRRLLELLESLTDSAA